MNKLQESTYSLSCNATTTDDKCLLQLYNPEDGRERSLFSFKIKMNTLNISSWTVRAGNGTDPSKS